MTTNIFLKVAGINGESTDVNHHDEIDVLSWSWGVTYSISSPAGAGSGVGKALVGSLSIGKELDKASPGILRFCLTGKHITSVVLTQRRPGAGPMSFLTITLQGVLVAGVTDTSPEGALRPGETITLTFAKVTYRYVPLKPNGQPDTPVTLKWNVKTNQEF